MTRTGFTPLLADIRAISPVDQVGRVASVKAGCLVIKGLSAHAELGDRVEIKTRAGGIIKGEVLRFGRQTVTVLPDGNAQGVSFGDMAVLKPDAGLNPDGSWIGRIIDPEGHPLDGRPLGRGLQKQPLQRQPPPATERKALGPRLETGMRLFNTLLPIARGQRIGLFAGSGVGKSTLIGHFARHLQADVCVIALVGERGRELRDFVEGAMGPDGMARSVVVAATSDRSPLEKRRAAWSAMAIAEFFRDQGLQVLLVVDSITRFAEAHREIAIAEGEAASMRGFPPSVSQMIMSLSERAGPGLDGTGDITAVFNVLVAGSDMEEPIADIIRGVLDGHIVMDRRIAERGRFPAVDVLRSVSRSLPNAASPDENALIAKARAMLGAYDAAELMIKSGLYEAGADIATDAAVKVYPALDRFFAEKETGTSADSFSELENCLSPAPSK